MTKFFKDKFLQRYLFSRDSYVVHAMVLLNVFNLYIFLQESFSISSVFKYAIVFMILFLLIDHFVTFGFSKNVLDSNRFFLPFFIIWFFILLVFVSKFSMEFFQNVFVNQLYVMPYFISLIALVSTYNLSLFRILLKLAFYFAVIAVIVKVGYFFIGMDSESNYANYIIASLNFAPGLLLFCSHFFKNKLIFRLALSNIILNITAASIFGSRGGVLYYIYILIFFLIIRLKSPLIHKEYKDKYLRISFFVVLFIVLLFPVLEKNVYVFQRGFNSEGFEDSRGDVFKAFFADFHTNNDWAFGRGFDGTVVRSIKIDDGEVVAGIENGYLTLLLKGGLFYLIPMLIMFIHSFYLCFFRTNNDFTKALGATVFIHLIQMFSFGIPETTSTYLLVWICVSAGYSKSLRNLSNKEIYQFFNE